MISAPALRLNLFSQCEVEAETACEVVANLNCSAMQQHGVLYNGKTKTCAAHLAAAALVYTIETLKDACQMLVRNTDTIVAEGETPAVVVING